MLKSFFKVVSKNLMFLLLLFGIILGIILGLFLNDKVQHSTSFTPRELAMFIGFPGELFLRMLMLVVLPLIVSSIITSLTIIDKNAVAKIGKRAVVYFLVTSLIATSLAVALGRVTIKPRTQKALVEDTKPKTGSSPIYAILDMFRNMVPDNIVETSISSTGTKLERKVTDFKLVNKSADVLKSSAANLSSFLKKEVINPWSISPDSVQVIKEGNVIYEYVGQEKYNSANILGAVVLSVVFGIILNSLGEKGKPIADWCSCLYTVVMKTVDILTWFSPIGVSSIVVSQLVAMQDIKGIAENLGLLIGTVFAGTIVYGFIILPVIYAILLRKNPFRLLNCVAKPLLIAFGTASSSATIPTTLSCLEKKRFVDGRLARFLLPIATIANVPGSAIYIALVTIFLIQTFHPSIMSFTSSILICLSSSIAVLASAPIPAATPLAVKNVVLQIIGIPTADIGLIIAIDWIIDRFATIVNVWSCCVACVIIEHYSRDELQSLDDVTTCTKETCSTVSDNTNTDVTIDIAEEVEVTIQTEDNKEAHTA